MVIRHFKDCLYIEHHQRTTKDKILLFQEKNHIALGPYGRGDKRNLFFSHVTVTGVLRDVTHVCAGLTAHWHRRLVKQAFDLSSHEFRVKRFSVFRSSVEGIRYLRFFYSQGREGGLRNTRRWLHKENNSVRRGRAIGHASKSGMIGFSPTEIHV